MCNRVKRHKGKGCESISPQSVERNRGKLVADGMAGGSAFGVEFVSLIFLIKFAQLRARGCVARDSIKRKTICLIQRESGHFARLFSDALSFNPASE